MSVSHSRGGGGEDLGPSRVRDQHETQREDGREGCDQD